MFGTTMTYDANAASAKSSHEVGEKVWCEVPSTFFDLRIGPNYSWNKKKSPAPPPFYQPIGCDLYFSPKN